MPVSRRRGGSQMMMRGDPLIGFIYPMVRDAPGGGLWYPLRNLGSVGVAPNEADRTAFGAELITNSNFANFTGDDPTGWTVANENDTTRLVEANANGLRVLDTDGTSTAVLCRQYTSVQGKTYRTRTIVYSRASGDILTGLPALGQSLQISAAGDYWRDFVATAASMLGFQSGTGTGNHEAVIRQFQAQERDGLDARIVGSPSAVTTPQGALSGLQINANGKYLQIPSQTRLNTLLNATRFTWLMRARFNASAATRFIWSVDSTNLNVSIAATTDRLVMRVPTTTTPTGDALAISTPAVLEDGTWMWCGGDFNSPEKPNGIRLFSGTTTLTEMALATDDTLGAARPTYSTQALYWFNRLANDAHMNGDADAVFMAGDTYTLAELNGILARSAA